jgi:hypothetical protein
VTEHEWRIELLAAIAELKADLSFRIVGLLIIQLALVITVLLWLMGP